MCIMNRIANSNVYIGRVEQLLSDLLPKRRVIVITDSNIDRCYPALISSYEHIIIGLGEQAKNLTTLEKVYTQLMEMGADRSTFLLGIGGGIVTDITGFVGATYMRGVDFGFVSTTLLGQVDASVGGKNGVNVEGYKNMVGTFTQPKFVICDVDLLRTLSPREFRTGLAEIIKAAVIADAELFEMLEQTDFSTLQRDSDTLREMVYRAIKVKADIVERDERESGDRRLLNLGHTLAHAIEKCSREFVHGEAVAIGMRYIGEAAVRAGVTDEATVERICALLQGLELPTECDIPMTQLTAALRKDKKGSGASIHVVFPCAIGSCEVQTLPYTTLDNYLKY